MSLDTAVSDMLHRLDGSASMDSDDDDDDDAAMDTAASNKAEASQGMSKSVFKGAVQEKRNKDFFKDL